MILISLKQGGRQDLRDMVNEKKRQKKKVGKRLEKRRAEGIKRFEDKRTKKKRSSSETVRKETGRCGTFTSFHHQKG